MCGWHKKAGFAAASLAFYWLRLQQIVRIQHVRMFPKICKFSLFEFVFFCDRFFYGCNYRLFKIVAAANYRITRVGCLSLIGFCCILDLTRLLPKMRQSLAILIKMWYTNFSTIYTQYNKLQKRCTIWLKSIFINLMDLNVSTPNPLTFKNNKLKFIDFLFFFFINL